MVESGRNTVNMKEIWQTRRPIANWKIPSQLKNSDIEKVSILMRSHKMLEKPYFSNGYLHRVRRKGFEEIKEFLESWPLFWYGLPTFHEQRISCIRTPLRLREVLKTNSWSFSKRQCILNDLLVGQSVERLLRCEGEYLPYSHTKRPNVGVCGKCS